MKAHCQQGSRIVTTTLLTLLAPPLRVAQLERGLTRCRSKHARKTITASRLSTLQSNFLTLLSMLLSDRLQFASESRLLRMLHIQRCLPIQLSNESKDSTLSLSP
jgi:hypothetical protein